MLWSKIIPEKKTGSPLRRLSVIRQLLVTDRQNVNQFQLASHGREYALQIRQSAGTLPLLTETEPVQLYATSCAYYQDSDETNHQAIIHSTKSSDLPLSYATAILRPANL
jgi:hypothetical protein